jgi:predicted nuclease of predicted toxin-antitoxin system
MKLLFDQNLSFRLCRRLSDTFPGSEHVGRLGLSSADDRSVWDAAKAGGFTLVSLDADLAEMATLLGPPPKVIWLRCGNRPYLFIAGLIQRHRGVIDAFAADPELGCLELYG